MKEFSCAIHYGKTEINYKLLMIERKSLEIAVLPDKSVVVKAPASTTPEVIEEKMKKRARWIQRRIAYFDQFTPRTPERKYVGGESHLYLGRKYRLKIEKSDENEVLLKNGYFFIRSESGRPEQIKEQMGAWYKKRAETVLLKIFEDSWETFKKKGTGKPNLKLQKMNKRWGSLSVKDRLTLNVKLIQAPKECIEYVVFHELCHLIHRNHGPEFYKLLERTMPDWMKRKHKLEMTLL